MKFVLLNILALGLLEHVRGPKPKSKKLAGLRPIAAVLKIECSNYFLNALTSAFLMICVYI